MASTPATPKQLVLDIGVQIQQDANGIEMCVLDNGIPFLTQNGLAKIAGTARSRFRTGELESRRGLFTVHDRSQQAAQLGRPPLRQLGFFAR